MIEKRVFTKHAAERYLERYPNLDFMMACSQVKRLKDKRTKQKERSTKCKVYKSWLGPKFIVSGNLVLTVY